MAPASDLNEELMRIIGTRLGGHDAVGRVDKFPVEKPDRIVATFAESLYPTPVSTGWLELRLRLNDDLNIIYIEDWAGDRWECRWDRHDNDHNSREHFHPPPTVTTATAMDVDLPADPNRAVETALRFVEDRIRDLWQAEELTFPSDYEFHHEYGPDIWK
jgi:hypothetical protein